MTTIPTAPPALPVSLTPNNWLSIATPGTLTGDPAMNNQLAAQTGGDILVGGPGDDTFIAYDPNTVIQGGGGTDTVETWGSGYTLPGGVANLTLEGSANAFATGNSGNNIITGNAGIDTLTTGGGNDILVAGTGADTFVATVQANTTTWIEGFKTATDHVDLSAYGFSSFAAVQAAMTQSGANVALNLGNGQLLMLQGQTVSSITAGNIILPSAPAISSSSSSLPTNSSTPGTPSGMTMTFDDEFNSLSLNMGTAATANGTWNTWFKGFNVRTLSGNAEQEIYVDPAYAGSSGSPLGLNPFSDQNGVLTISASPTPAQDLQYLGNAPYISGTLNTQGSFSQTYGYFEMRAELPAGGQGLWPAFWLLPENNSWPPEIDVFEQVDSPTSNIVTTVHDVTGNSGTSFNIGDTSAGFHTYGVLWTSQAITFYVDGQKMFSTPTPADYNQPMYMLMDLAVGGTWPGSPNSSTNWAKANLNVDYVRAYSLSNTAMAAPATISTSGGTVTSTSTTTGSTTTGSTTTGSTTTGTTSSGSTGSTSTGTATAGSMTEPTAILSNATDPTNLTSHFNVPSLSPGTSVTYTAGQLGISGVASSVTVTVADDLNNGLTVTNNGAWGGIKDVTINSPANGIVNINNFVDAQVQLGDGGSTITATNLMRGTITAGNGNDIISVTAKSNSSTNNTTTISAGDGSDHISFTGSSNTRAVISAGNLGNTITVSGKASATVTSGTGNDDFVDNSTGVLKLTGGGGSDVFEFLAGAHATITDFQAGQDNIVLHGLTASQVHVSTSQGNTFITFGTGQIELAGVALTARKIHTTFA
jgi:beta-glucanase (GH16 family)